MKVFFWDKDGLVIWFKRLEKGTFTWKWGDKSRIDRRTFFMLLEGVIPKRLQARYKYLEVIFCQISLIFYEIF